VEVQSSPEPPQISAKTCSPRFSGEAGDKATHRALNGLAPGSLRAVWDGFAPQRGRRIQPRVKPGLSLGSALGLNGTKLRLFWTKCRYINPSRGRRWFLDLPSDDFETSLHTLESKCSMGFQPVFCGRATERRNDEIETRTMMGTIVLASCLNPSRPRRRPSSSISSRSADRRR
jgi:hypothetical protein